MKIEKSYKIALRFAFQAGAEYIANPGHEDCGILASRDGFAFYCEVEKFNDLPDGKKQGLLSRVA